MSVFTPKQVFGPHTAKSQPIWIKFCTHLLSYGIVLWADLDRDRRVGGSRQTRTTVFSILVTHPKSYRETMDRLDFGGKPTKWRWGRVLSWKIPEFCSVDGARSKEQQFPRFQCTLRLSCAQPIYTGNSFTMESRDSGGVPFASLESLWPGIWQIYRPLNGAEKWSRDHHENWKFTYRHTWKNSLITEMLFFSIYDENNEVIAGKNRFRTVASPGALWTLGRLELTLVVNTSF